MLKLNVVRVERNLMGSKITVEASETVSATYGSPMGNREFFLPEGERLMIAVKGKYWRRGDTITMAELVTLARDWSKIPYIFSWMKFAPNQ